MKKIVILLVILSSFMLSACFFPTGEKKDSSSSVSLNNSDEDPPEFVDTKLEEDLIVKADVSAGKNEKLHSSSISLKTFDEEQIKETILENKTIEEIHENKNDRFPEHVNKYFQMSDESYLILEPGSIRFADKAYSDREYENIISGSTYFIRSDLKKVYKKSDLDGINKDEAIEIVSNAAKGAGISQLGNPEVISLDYETLESEWEEYETKPGVELRKWEKEDEAYVVIFSVVQDDLTITNKGYFSASSQMSVIGSRIMGVVSKKGLIFFTASDIYEIEETLNKNITPISLESALEKVKSKYKDVLITDPILISKISLEYVPVISSTEPVSYELVPAWVFTGEQDVTFNDKGGTFKAPAEFSIMFNAENGQEIRIGGER